ncbi:hypothetical protein D3C76_1235700 [compost metagenome]
MPRLRSKGVTRPARSMRNSPPERRTMGRSSPCSPMLFCMVPSQSRPWASQRASLARLPGCGSATQNKVRRGSSPGEFRSSRYTPLLKVTSASPLAQGMNAETCSGICQICTLAPISRSACLPAMSTQYSAWVGASQNGPSPSCARCPVTAVHVMEPPALLLFLSGQPAFLSAMTCG